MLFLCWLCFSLLFSVALYCSGSASNQAWVWVGLRGSSGGDGTNGTFVSSPVIAVLSFGSSGHRQLECRCLH